ncbi:hypothetical protein BGX28_001288 [Mortierella sp. GBA30]|nr:hypothetical protein BGX28_001288 [Mortierella sp. GBA30]
MGRLSQTPGEYVEKERYKGYYYDPNYKEKRRAAELALQARNRQAQVEPSSSTSATTITANDNHVLRINTTSDSTIGKWHQHNPRSFSKPEDISRYSGSRSSSHDRSSAPSTPTSSTSTGTFSRLNAWDRLEIDKVRQDRGRDYHPRRRDSYESKLDRGTDSSVQWGDDIYDKRHSETYKERLDRIHREDAERRKKNSEQQLDSKDVTTKDRHHRRDADDGHDVHNSGDRHRKRILDNAGLGSSNTLSAESSSSQTRDSSAPRISGRNSDGTQASPLYQKRSVAQRGPKYSDPLLPHELQQIQKLQQRLERLHYDDKRKFSRYYPGPTPSFPSMPLMVQRAVLQSKVVEADAETLVFIAQHLALHLERSAAMQFFCEASGTDGNDILKEISRLLRVAVDKKDDAVAQREALSRIRQISSLTKTSTPSAQLPEPLSTPLHDTVASTTITPVHFASSPQEGSAPLTSKTLGVDGLKRKSENSGDSGHRHIKDSRRRSSDKGTTAISFPAVHPHSSSPKQPTLQSQGSTTKVMSSRQEHRHQQQMDKQLHVTAPTLDSQPPWQRHSNEQKSPSDTAMAADIPLTQQPLVSQQPQAPLEEGQQADVHGSQVSIETALSTSSRAMPAVESIVPDTPVPVPVPPSSQTLPSVIVPIIPGESNSSAGFEPRKSQDVNVPIEQESTREPVQDVSTLSTTTTTAASTIQRHSDNNAPTLISDATTLESGVDATMHEAMLPNTALSLDIQQQPSLTSSIESPQPLSSATSKSTTSSAAMTAVMSPLLSTSSLPTFVDKMQVDGPVTNTQTQVLYQAQQAQGQGQEQEHGNNHNNIGLLSEQLLQVRVQITDVLIAFETESRLRQSAEARVASLSEELQGQRIQALERDLEAKRAEATAMMRKANEDRQKTRLEIEIARRETAETKLELEMMKRQSIAAKLDMEALKRETAEAKSEAIRLKQQLENGQFQKRTGPEGPTLALKGSHDKEERRGFGNKDKDIHGQKTLDKERTREKGMVEQQEHASSSSSSSSSSSPPILVCCDPEDNDEVPTVFFLNMSKKPGDSKAIRAL